MSIEPDERAKELMQEFLGLKLFAVVFAGSGEDIMPDLTDHLEYLVELERSGSMFACGPYGDGKPGDSLMILRADTIEAAEALASANPFVARTGQTFTVRPWVLNQGNIRLTVNASRSAVTVT